MAGEVVYFNSKTFRLSYGDFTLALKGVNMNILLGAKIGISGHRKVNSDDSYSKGATLID
jgi:hypothetical protein